ncbi:MAG: hypothetical protein Q9221_006626 [Calogaya cf. arnoldii]
MSPPKFLVLFVSAIFFMAIQPILTAPALRTPTLESRGSWPQWPGIEKLFVFGASYTSTGFKSGPTGLPDAAHPWGNQDRGLTNGHNFVMYLTDTFNASQVLTYNFAYPGAQISGEATTGKPGNDLVEQAGYAFWSGYTPAGALHEKKTMRTQWHGSSSLFLFFFGVNDNQMVYNKPNYLDLLDRDFAAYEKSLNQLYSFGARNFLLLNTPPMDNMPDFTGAGGVGKRVNARERALIKRSVDAFNVQISALVLRFRTHHPDAAIAVFETHALFTEMQTSLQATNALMTRYESNQLTYLKEACPAYETDGRPYLGSNFYFEESCGVDISRYFWLNRLHPTWSVHKVMAGRIAEFLWGWRP